MDPPTRHPHLITVTYQTDLGFDGLIACLKQAGPITMVEVISESPTTQTARITFKNQKDATVAERSKDLWLLENALAPDNDRMPTSPQKSRK